jgi:hypothetical protein
MLFNSLPVDEKPVFTGTRLQIARLLAEDHLTLYEIARAVGKPTGSVSGLVHRMTEEGWLRADPDPPIRGSQFSLREEHLERLERELDAVDPEPGVLAAQQQVVLADAHDRRAYYEIMARPAIAGIVAWTADFDGTGTRLIVLREGTDELDLDRLIVAFQDAEISVRAGRLGEPQGGATARAFGASVRRRTPRKVRV